LQAVKTRTLTATPEPDPATCRTNRIPSRQGGSAKGTDDIVAVMDVVREARSFRQDIEAAEVNEGPSDAANPTA